MKRKVKEAASVQEYIYTTQHLKWKSGKSFLGGGEASSTPSGYEKPPGKPSSLGNHRDPYMMNRETRISLRRQSLAKSLKKKGQPSDTTHTSRFGLGNKMALGSGDMASNLGSAM